MSVGRGAGPSLTKTQPAWHVNYFIYIDNLSPVSLSLSPGNNLQYLETGNYEVPPPVPLYCAVILDQRAIF